MKTQLILLSLLAISTASCTRPENKARVRIQLPSQEQLAKLSSAVSTTSGKVSAQNGGGWGLPIPSSAKTLNCFAVLVGGPEDNLRDKACTKGFGASFEKFYFNGVHGFSAAGSDILIENIKAGSGRTFYVIGAAQTGSCQDFNKPENLNQTVMSNPVLVGRAVADIGEGTNNVTIEASMPANTDTAALTGCSFFGGTAGAADNIRLRGAINSDSGGTAMLGFNTCNPFRVEIRSGDNDALVDSTVIGTLNLTSVSGTNGTLFSSSDCSSTPASTVTFAPGEYFKDLYYKAISSYGTTDLTISIPSGSTSVNHVVRLDTGYAMSGNEKLRFMSDSLTMAPNTCTDIKYWAISPTSMRTINFSGSLALNILDLAGTIQVSGQPTSQFRSSCSGAAVTHLTSSDSNFSFYLGGDYKDFAIGQSSEPFNNVRINILPRAKNLDLSAPNMNPWASDCVPLSITPRHLDGGGSVADLSGFDSSPWSIAKRIIGQLYSKSSVHPDSFLDSQCINQDTSTNREVFSMVNGSTIGGKYLRFQTSGTVAMEAWADRFTSEQRGATANFNVKWDPSVLFKDGWNQYFSAYFMPAGDISTLLTPKVFYGSAFTLSTTGAGITTDGLGPGNDVINFPESSDMQASSLGMYSSLSYGVLINSGAVAANKYIVQAKDSSSNQVATLATDGANQIRLLAINASTQVFSPTASLSNNTWTSVIVTRTATSCRMYVNGTLAASVACDSNLPVETVTLNDLSNGLAMQMGELFFVAKELTAAEITQTYNYLKARYPDAALP